MLDRKIVLAAALALATGACSMTGGNRPLPLSDSGTPGLTAMRPDFTPVSVLKGLTKQVVIGSTVDPLNGDQNPYGLTIAQEGYGKVKAGDLFVCNFNNKKNVQGTGTTVISLAPTPGAKPARFAQSSALLGCAAIDFEAADAMFAAAFGNQSETVLSAAGKVTKTYKGGNYVRPFGTKTGQIGTTYGSSYVFGSDASKGTIVLVESCEPSSPCQPSGKAIISGFKVNNGKPGNIFGPSGLAFDQYECGPHNACGTLYVVDGVTNTLYSFSDVGNMRNANSVVIGPTGKTFSGPFKAFAHVVYQGSPLNGPISAAIVYSAGGKPGNIVVGNTKGANLLIEISPTGKVLDTVNVDKGAAGALFGIVGNSIGAKATTSLYFNDDNANNVQVLQK